MTGQPRRQNIFKEAYTVPVGRADSDSSEASAIDQGSGVDPTAVLWSKAAHELSPTTATPKTTSHTESDPRSAKTSLRG